MEINIGSIKTKTEDNGLKIYTQEEPMYILGNIHNYDFKEQTSFNNHYSNNPNFKIEKVERHGICALTSAEYFNNKFFINITLLIDAKLDNITMLYLYNTVFQTISTTSWDVDAIGSDKLDNELGNFYNIIYVACTGKSERYLPFDISLFYEAKEIVDESLRKSFKNIGYPQNIIDKLDVSINDIITTTCLLNKIDTDEFKTKLEINLKKPEIVALLDATLKFNMDILKGRIPEIKSYNNDTFGLLIANTIGSDKYYKEYIQKKPGILHNLPYLKASIIAGLISGCLSENKLGGIK